MNRQLHPLNKGEPVKYQCYDSCNKCGGNNDCVVIDQIGYIALEYKTECLDCGFEDYWAHGFFESSQYIESKCKTYSFCGG